MVVLILNNIGAAQFDFIRIYEMNENSTIDSSSVKSLSDQVLRLECSDPLCSVADSSTLALWNFNSSYADASSNQYTLKPTNSDFVELGFSNDFKIQLKASSKVLDGGFIIFLQKLNNVLKIRKAMNIMVFLILSTM